MSDLDKPYKTSPDAYKTSLDARKDIEPPPPSSERLQNDIRSLFTTPQNSMLMFSSSFRTAVGAKGQLSVDVEDPSEAAWESGMGTPQKLHNYTVVNASSGATPKVTITPGTHIDSGSGLTLIPTISGTPIFPLPSPKLTVGNTDVVVYFHGIAAAGATSAIEILSGASVPMSTATDWYQLVAFITVSIVAGVASVVSNEGGVGASQCSQYCNGWLFGGQS